MDKLEKVRAEIERRAKILSGTHAGRSSDILPVLEELLSFINSMQEEPKFKVGDRIRLKGTTAKGDVIKNIYKAEDGNVYFEFENSDDALADDRWQLVEELKVPIVETADGGLWNGNMKEEPKCIYNHSLEERQRFCKYCSAACQVRVKEEPKDKCKGCNNVKGCITCVDGSEWAHYEEAKLPPVFDEGYWERLGEDLVSDIDFEQELYKAFGQVKDFTLGLQIAKRFYDMGKNHQEPVREELEEAARKFIEPYREVSECGTDYNIHPARVFKAGAKWQAEEFEKNRLKHCNSITNEQAELEQGFIDQHLDKHQRMPTFLDAIEYGMQLMKKQLMKDAFDVKINRDTLYDLKPFIHEKYLDYKIGDKCKMILIKED